MQYGLAGLWIAKVISEVSLIFAQLYIILKTDVQDVINESQERMEKEHNS